ncbi:hypothetical protein [Arthrobacter sp. TB 23]|uniref:hypothetical protein n=1 Tax=Arthrobacter sp. TB 23 TaxID=494419 RepID=UPI001ED8C62D|nr:hypothetical protein [Arthrobacter sp. TB 23]
MRGTVAGMRAMPYVEPFAWKTRAITDPKMGNSALLTVEAGEPPPGSSTPPCRALAASL